MQLTKFHFCRKLRHTKKFILRVTELQFHMRIKVRLQCLSCQCSFYAFGIWYIPIPVLPRSWETSYCFLKPESYIKYRSICDRELKAPHNLHKLVSFLMKLSQIVIFIRFAWVKISRSKSIYGNPCFIKRSIKQIHLRDFLCVFRIDVQEFKKFFIVYFTYHRIF